MIKQTKFKLLKAKKRRAQANLLVFKYISRKNEGNSSSRWCLCSTFYQEKMVFYLMLVVKHIKQVVCALRDKVIAQ
jgi:hypothetical protein